MCACLLAGATTGRQLGTLSPMSTCQRPNLDLRGVCRNVQKLPALTWTHAPPPKDIPRARSIYVSLTSLLPGCKGSRSGGLGSLGPFALRSLNSNSRKPHLHKAPGLSEPSQTSKNNNSTKQVTERVCLRKVGPNKKWTPLTAHKPDALCPSEKPVDLSSREGSVGLGRRSQRAARGGN